MQQITNPNTTEIKPDLIKMEILNSIRNFYDIQKLRISIGNRVYAALASKLDLDLDTESEEESKEAVEVMKKAINEFNVINNSLKAVDIAKEIVMLRDISKDELETLLTKMTLEKNPSYSKDKVLLEDAIKEYNVINKFIAKNKKYENIDVQKVIDKLDSKLEIIKDKSIYLVLYTYVSKVTKEDDYFKNLGFNPGSNPRVDTIIKKLDDRLELIKNRIQYDLVSMFVNMEAMEDNALKIVETNVKQHPMWDRFFKDVKGCGVLLAGVCISSFDIHKARHVSSFWSYAGVGVRLNEETGKYEAMSRKNLIDQEYIDKDGNIATRKSLGYNSELQSKLLSVFVSSTLKTGKGSKYNECYYSYKHRYENREDLKDTSKMHIHRMAARETVKALLRDLWVEWRSYEGYEISQPYEVEYLKKAPHKFNEAHCRKSTV